MGSTPQGPYGKPPSGQPAPMNPNDFTPAVRNAMVHFATCEIDPPSAAYVDVDDQFQIGAIANFNIGLMDCNIRVLRPHGQIETVKLQINLLGQPNLVTVQLPSREGYILSAEIAPQGNIATNFWAYVWQCSLAVLSLH